MTAVKIVLVEPEIPPNTGNIGRLCVGLGLPLYLVGKLGFTLDDTKLKRAGLDYWPKLDLHIEPDAAVFKRQLAAERPLLFSKKADRLLWDVDLTAHTALVFGKETLGLSDDWLAMDAPKVKLPQSEHIRSYNLANVVAAAAFEWARQARFRTTAYKSS